MKANSKILLAAGAGIAALCFLRKNKSVSGIGKADRYGGKVTITEGMNMLNNALYGKEAAKIVFRYQGEDPVVIYWNNRYGRKGYKEVNAEFAKYFKPYNFTGADVYYGYAISGNCGSVTETGNEKTTIREAWKNKRDNQGFVIFKDIEYPNESQVWILDGYDRSYREYELHNAADANKFKSVKGDKVCYTGFYF